jgi:hypothetical protein
MFDVSCKANGVTHRLAKPTHPWTDLREYFTRDVDLLGGLIGRDLRSWMEISTVRVGAEVPAASTAALTLARTRRSEVPFRGGDSPMSGRLEWDDHG